MKEMIGKRQGTKEGGEEKEKRKERTAEDLRKEARQRKKWEGAGERQREVGNSVIKKRARKESRCPPLRWACNALTPLLLPWLQLWFCSQQISCQHLPDSLVLGPAHTSVDVTLTSGQFLSFHLPKQDENFE